MKWIEKRKERGNTSQLNDKRKKKYVLIVIFDSFVIIMLLFACFNFKTIRSM